MKVGDFSPDGLEYIITTPYLPHFPHINFLGTAKSDSNSLVAKITQTGGGDSFYKDPAKRRILATSPRSVPPHQPGRTFYIDDISQGNRNLWNPGWLPIQNNEASFKCTHGLGYTVINGALNGLEVDIAFTIPINYDVELHYLQLRNNSSHDREIRLTSLIQWALWDYFDYLFNEQRNRSTAEIQIMQNGHMIVHSTDYQNKRNHFAAYATGKDTNVVQIHTDLTQFLGSPFNGFHNPKTVLEPANRNQYPLQVEDVVYFGGNIIASQTVAIQLPKHATKELVFGIGYFENPFEEKWRSEPIDLFVNTTGAEKVFDYLLQPENAKQELQNVKDYWRNFLSSQQISDLAGIPGMFRKYFNGFLPYNAQTTFRVGRSYSESENNPLRNGMGFRDWNQDTQTQVYRQPEKVIDAITTLATIQYKDGHCDHQYDFTTESGNANIGARFSDDPLRIPESLSHYLKVTGDFGALNRIAPFADEEDKANSKTTLFDHLKVSIHHIVKNLGDHDLPLLFAGTWNDCFNLDILRSESYNPNTYFQVAKRIDPPKSEAVDVGSMFVEQVKEYIEICKKLGNQQEEIVFAEKALENMETNVLKAFNSDAGYFAAAYDRHGSLFGAAETDGRIYLMPQVLSVIAGIGLDNGIAEKCLNTMYERLSTKYGMCLLDPPFRTFADKPGKAEHGEQRTYMFAKENGIFHHPTAWAIRAETILAHALLKKGNHDEATIHAKRAWEYWNIAAPYNWNDRVEIRGGEPYAVSQTAVTHHANKNVGMNRNFWLTGFAQWSAVVIFEDMLGIKPGYDNITIEPCMDPNFEHFTVDFNLRGARYTLIVNNPSHQFGGIESMKVDGKNQYSNIIPYAKPNTTCTIEAVIGAHSK